MRSSPHLSAFPALGHDVSIDYRTHPRDLLAQKLNLFVPVLAASYRRRKHRVNRIEYTNLAANAFQLAYPLSAVMLIAWAVVTFAYDGPGWVHFLLSLGMFLLIWRIVAGGTPDAWRKYLSGPMSLRD